MRDRRLFCKPIVLCLLLATLLVGARVASSEQGSSVFIADNNTPRWAPWELFTVPAEEGSYIDPVAVSLNSPLLLQLTSLGLPGAEFGQLLMAATQTGAGPERILLRSSGNEGESWSAGAPLAQARPGYKLSATSAGTLRSGTILLATTEYRHTKGTIQPDGEEPRGVPRFKWSGFQSDARATIWRSTDSGKTWESTAIGKIGPFLSASTCGHFIEMADGSVIVNVYGPASEREESAALSSVGFIRSSDGGATWKYSGTIARADERKRISFGPADIASVLGGRLVCLAQMDFRGRGEHAFSRIGRAYGSNSGAKWTKTEQVLVGPRPSVLGMPDGTVLCTSEDDHQISFSVSHDGAASWVGTTALATLPDFRLPNRGGGATWLCPIDGRGVLALWHAPKMEGVQDDQGRQPDSPKGRMKTRGNITVKWSESTEVVGTFIRKRAAMWPAALPAQSAGVRLSSPRVSERWELGEAFTLQLPELASGGLCYTSLNRLPNGEWMVMGARLPGDQPAAGRIGVEGEQEGTEYVLLKSKDLRKGWTFAGMLPMRSVKRPPGSYGFSLRSIVRTSSGRLVMDYMDDTRPPVGVVIAYSDDDNKTWQAASFPPVPQYYIPMGSILMRPSGRLLIYGYDGRGLLVHESLDDGATWREASVAPAPAAMVESEGLCYTEQGFTVLPDGRWVQSIRAQFGYRDHTPRDWMRSLALIYSQDEGRTWTPPQYKLFGIETELATLPGGAFYVGSRLTQGMFWISYDWGQTFVQQETIYDGPEIHRPNANQVDTPRPIVLDENTVLLVANAAGPQVLSTGSLYCRYLHRVRR